jgi:hypothetical protein
MHGGRHGIRGGQYYGPAILPDGIIFSANEQTSNVWLGELKD